MDFEIVITITLILIPGIGLLFACILAFQGQRFLGSWLMLIGTSLSIISFLGFLALAYWSDNLRMQLFAGGKGGYKKLGYEKALKLAEQVETAALISFILPSFFLTAGAIGFLLLAQRWIALHRQCHELELKAERLATQRDIPLGAAPSGKRP